MALNIVAEYLSAIAFKDLFREPRKQNGRTTWQTGMARISRGFVDWPLTLKTLKSMNFTGPISMHSEYGGEPVESVIDLTRIDLRYIRRVLDDVSSE
jgi:sugar phosphate isomerase/epimerase